MHTSCIQALMFNLNRGQNTSPRDFYHYHPYMKKPKATRVPTAEELKDIFSGGGKCPAAQSGPAKP